jgi:hypothetical protein
MSATSISLRDFVETLRATVPYVHPAGRATIDDWLTEALDAADHGDAATVARLASFIAEKVEQELQWQADDARDVLSRSASASMGVQDAIRHQK